MPALCNLDMSPPRARPPMPALCNLDMSPRECAPGEVDSAPREWKRFDAAAGLLLRA
jgi:hypothetical protein